MATTDLATEGQVTDLVTAMAARIVELQTALAGHANTVLFVNALADVPAGTPADTLVVVRPA